MFKKKKHSKYINFNLGITKLKLIYLQNIWLHLVNPSFLKKREVFIHFDTERA